MAGVSVIVPVGPRHDKIVWRAIDSIHAQTVESVPIVIRDTKGRGPAWARNVGIVQCKTPWLVFLDADDELEPLFVERALSAAKDDHYVYTSWYQDKDSKQVEIVRADKACEVWRANGKVHLITALVPTKWAKVAGFDESMKLGGEDIDFWYALTRAGCCPIRLDEPLCWYHHGGEKKRSQIWRDDIAARKTHNQILLEKYGGIEMGCRSCGGSRVPPPQQSTSRAVTMGNHSGPGEFDFDRGDRIVPMKIDTLVKVLKAGRAHIVGRSTGYAYPRVGRGDRLWVDKRDAKIMPGTFRMIEPPRRKKLVSIPEELKPKAAAKPKPKAVTKKPKPKAVKLESIGNPEKKKKPDRPTNGLEVLVAGAIPGVSQKRIPPAPAKPAKTDPDYERVIKITAGIYS